MQDQLFYKRVGERIQAERERAALSREGLAGRVNISAKFLYEIENGRKGFSCEVFYKICDILHVDPTYMLKGGYSPSDMSKIEYMLRDFNRKDMSYLVRLMEEICKLRSHIGE